MTVAVTAPSTVACVSWDVAAVNAPGAFDLVPTSDGALLVWATATGVHVQVLERHGAARGEPRDLVSSPQLSTGADVVELVAASAAGEVGVAWVTRGAIAYTAFAGRANERHPQVVEVQVLGDVEPAVATRGRVLIAAAEDGELQATWRSGRADCQAQQGVCSHYSRRAIGAGSPERGVIAREMVAPCDPMLVGSLWADGSWYEAVCHRDPSPVAYLFSFRPEISYAEATDLFSGCSAFAMARAQAGAALWAQCNDGLALATRSHVPTQQSVLRGVHKSARCVAGRPVLSARGPGGSVQLSLNEPVDNIGATLPGLPLETRAVWTGTHVIAAFSDGLKLRLKTGACIGDAFEWCESVAGP